MANYILYLYKTVRKFWGEAIVVTQELDDIISNPIVKESIINNSDTICLLDQSKFKDNYDVDITMTLTTPHCPEAQTIPEKVADVVSLVKGVDEV